MPGSHSKKDKLKKKIAKVRKADQQDINRVKKWNSRSFNKNKELSGPTEPVFKPTANLRNRLAKVRKAMMPPEDPLNWLQHYEEEGFVEKKSKEGYNFPVKQLKDESKAVSTRNYRKKVNPPKLTRPSRSGRGATWKGTGTSAAYTSLEELEKGAKLKQRIGIIVAEGGEWKRKNKKKRKHVSEDIPRDSHRGGHPANYAKVRKADGGVAPNYNNPSKVRKKKTTTKAASLGALGWGKLDRKTGKPQKLKPRKKTLDDYPTEKAKLAAGVKNIGNKPWMKKKEIDKSIRPSDMSPEERKQRSYHIRNRLKNKKQKTALRSAVNKGVNKVNPIKPTKTYKKPPQGPNPYADTPDEIMKNAEVAGRKNDTYVGKTKKRIARIRKAGEQVDPRVKKRKTVRPDSPVQKVSQMKDRIAELKTAKEHNHSIAFRKHDGQYYKRASLTKQEGKYAKYWLLNAKQTNGNGWGVSPVSIAKNINKFIGRPFVVTAKQWVPNSEYGEQFEHPYLPTNNIDQIINHQEKFRVGSIVDIVEKGGDYHAVIEINSKFANMMLPPFCSPAIFQNNPGEADGEISDWEALHLAGLMEDPAYGASIALLKGSCMGTAEACSVQFKGAKQVKTVCPKKMSKLRGRLGSLKKNNKLKQRIATLQRLAVEQQITLEGDVAPERVRGRPRTVAKTKEEVIKAFKEGKPMRTKTPLRWGERLQPTYRTDGKNFFLHGNKILSKHESGYQTHVKGWLTESEFEQITLDTLRDFGIQVNSEGKIIPAKQFFTKDGLAMKIKTKGDLTKKDMVIPANEISDGRVLINKYKPPTGIKHDIYPYTPENLRNFSAESRRRATSMQVNSEGKRVPVGTLKGDPTGSKRRSLSETATQPEDAKTVNKILGLPEEQGLEKTFGKKKYDKKKTKTTYNKGKYKGIEGSKTHHILFKKKTGVTRPNPVARFKHTRNVKATPKGSFASSPFANNPENAIQLSKPEHKELHRLNPHSNFRRIFESKLRLKIARMRYAEEDWSDIQDKDFFNKPFKPRKMTPDMYQMDYMDSLHNEAAWNAGQRAMKRFEKELSHPFSRKYALKTMDGHAFNSSLMLQNNYPDLEDIMKKNDNDGLFSLLEGHNKEALESANYNIEDEFGFGDEPGKPTSEGEALGRALYEPFQKMKDEDYAKIPNRRGDMLKTKQIISDYTNDVSGGIMKNFNKYKKGLGAKRK